jgi:hypothetical protein
MPKSNVEQWLDNNVDASSDYPELVRRIKAGERVECVIETSEGSTLAMAEHVKTGFGQLFKLIIELHDDVRMYSVERDFIDCCSAGNVLFIKQDFLEALGKRLELAKNAATFKAVVVPLNSIEDVEALWALIDRANDGKAQR